MHEVPSITYEASYKRRDNYGRRDVFAPLFDVWDNTIMSDYEL